MRVVGGRDTCAARAVDSSHKATMMGASGETHSGVLRDKRGRIWQTGLPVLASLHPLRKPQIVASV